MLEMPLFCLSLSPLWKEQFISCVFGAWNGHFTVLVSYMWWQLRSTSLIILKYLQKCLQPLSVCQFMFLKCWNAAWKEFIPGCKILCRGDQGFKSLFCFGTNVWYWSSFAGGGAPRADKLWQGRASAGFVMGTDGGWGGDGRECRFILFSQGGVFEGKVCFVVWFFFFPPI